MPITGRAAIVLSASQFGEPFLKTVQLPSELAGNFMVFKTYEHLSYGLVMTATSEIHVGDLQTAGRILVETLLEFGIETQLTNYETGPVVTRYELLPAAGVRVERIAGLANNIALSMKAESVRVQAPIPGKGVVGIDEYFRKCTGKLHRAMDQPKAGLSVAIMEFLLDLLSFGTCGLGSFGNPDVEDEPEVEFDEDAVFDAELLDAEGNPVQ